MQVSLSSLQTLSEKSSRLEDCRIEELQKEKNVDGILRKHYSNQDVIFALRSKLQRLKVYYSLEFVQLFCHEAIKEIDISKEV